MLNIPYYFSISLLSFLLFFLNGAVFGQQKVSLSNESGLSYVKRLEQQGESLETIASTIENNPCFCLITPEVAQNTFNIAWLEGDDYISPLPRLLVAEIGDEVGYGLFSVDSIAVGTKVAEYAGSIITAPDSVPL